MNPSTQHDDRHVPLPPGNSERDFAVVGYAALSLQSPQMQLVEEFWEHRAIESDLARPLIEADPEARLNEREHRIIVTINLQEDVLTLEGARRPKQEQDANWQRRNRAYGRFSGAVPLPFRVDPDKVQARLSNGILEIELERLEADRPKKIQIRAT